MQARVEREVAAAGADRCDADAEWKVSFTFGGATPADVSVDPATASGTGCDRLPPSGTERFDVFGVLLVGAPAVNLPAGRRAQATTSRVRSA